MQVFHHCVRTGANLDAFIHHLNAVIEDVLTTRRVHISARDFEKFYMSYAKNKKDAAGVDLSDEVRLGLYLACRMPATTAALMRVFADLPEGFHPQTLCDLGSGSGSAVIAGAQTFGSLKEVTAFDTNEELLMLGGQILDEMAPHVKNNREIGSYTNVLNFPRTDLITMSYTLNEIPEIKRQEVIERAWEACEGMMVIVEPGSKPGFQTIMQVRDWAISQGIYVLAPCSHHGTCPLRDSDWCHFHARFPRSKRLLQVKRGTLGYEDEPYSYVALSRQEYDRGGKRVLSGPTKVAQGCSVSLCVADKPETRIVHKKDESFSRTKRLKPGEKMPN